MNEICEECLSDYLIVFEDLGGRCSKCELEVTQEEIDLMWLQIQQRYPGE